MFLVALCILMCLYLPDGDVDAAAKLLRDAVEGCERNRIDLRFSRLCMSIGARVVQFMFCLCILRLRLQSEAA